MVLNTGFGELRVRRPRDIRDLTQLGPEDGNVDEKVTNNRLNCKIQRLLFLSCQVSNSNGKIQGFPGVYGSISHSARGKHWRFLKCSFTSRHKGIT